MLSSVYGAAASWRRQWYVRDPRRVRKLARPVISVGNLRAGGSGKTPVVACIARLLLDRGERPAILSRGYGRRVAADGITVVSDGRRVLAGFDTAGDEPLMLARALPGVPVLVGANRFLSGCLAERRLGATIHILDDGFQHVQLARDVDLVLLDEADLDERVIPAGLLREPLSRASAADALLVTSSSDLGSSHVAAAVGAPRAFTVTRTIQAPRSLDGRPIALRRSEPVFVFAGIARPERFFADVASQGWHVAATHAFGDHHVFTQRDMRDVAARARVAGASIVMTTEKDAVRLPEHELTGLNVAVVPLTAVVEPADEFGKWLMSVVARVTPGRTQDAPPSQ